MIGIEVEGVEEIRAKLKLLAGSQPRQEMTGEVADYVIEYLQNQPAKKKVTRKQAFGRSFESDKQRRWFFASLADGSLVLPYGRTGQLKEGWKKRPLGSNCEVYNQVPYAKHVQGDGTQSRMMKIIGWRTATMTARELTFGVASGRIKQIANRFYDRFIKRIGL